MSHILNQRIALTGATGFLGSHIAIALAQSGATVRGVVRSPGKGAWLKEQHQITMASGDLSDEPSLVSAFEGCDVVVANAALAIRGRASWEAFREANVVGSENVLRAAAKAQVKRVVYISTVGVYKMRSTGKIDETTPLREGFEWDLSLLTTNWRYSASKSLGEQAAWAIAREHDIQMTVLRPGPIYGSRDFKMTQTFLGKMSKRFLLVPNVYLPMVHAGDVARATVSALERPLTSGKAYNITGESNSLVEVFKLLRELTHSSCWIIEIPLGLGQAFDNGAALRDLDLHYRSLRSGWTEVLESQS